jgi:hypothetical protein
MNQLSLYPLILKRFAMHRSNIGYIMLALLVITGLAGTISSTTLSHKDRRFAVDELKDNKSSLISAIEHLSNKQLNFKPAGNKYCIGQYVIAIIQKEQKVFNEIEHSLKQPAEIEKKNLVTITDKDIEAIICTSCSKESSGRDLSIIYNTSKSADELIKQFRLQRDEHINYIKITTEDIRGHFFQHPVLGTIDAYQYLLTIPYDCKNLVNKIDEIKSSPGFPAK